MRLLLTSSGLTNTKIAAALKKWVPSVKTAFIITAANTENSNKDWLVKDLSIFEKLGYIDIIDLAAMKKKEWLPRLNKANVIVVGGGDTKYLMQKMHESGFQKELPRLLNTRVYVGISAGSVVTGKRIWTSTAFLYGKNVRSAPKGLGLVDFNFKPHLNSPDFPKCKNKFLKECTKKIDGKTYALDDESAITWENGKIKVISEGKWILYN